MVSTKSCQQVSAQSDGPCYHAIHDHHTYFQDLHHITNKYIKCTKIWNLLVAEIKKSAKKLNIHQWKRHSEETQTLHAGCGKAEPKIFAAPQTPFPGVQDGQNLISWRQSLSLPTNSVWWWSMHAISSYRGNRPTHKHTNTQTGPMTIHCATA